MPGVKIRDAEVDDLAGLLALEARSFASDRIAPRSFKRLLRQPSASLRVAAGSGKTALHGYHLVLFRENSTVARLYSIAVDSRNRGAGLGRRLLSDAEAVAASAKRRVLRLEVRHDNLSALRLYERCGYHRIGSIPRYYADGAGALRYEKAIGIAGSDRSPPRRRRKRGG